MFGALGDTVFRSDTRQEFTDLEVPVGERFSHPEPLNPLPNEKKNGLAKIEKNCRRQNKCAYKMKFDLGRVENIVGKGENAGNQHFLLFPQCFTKPSSLGSLKVRIAW